MRLSFVGFAWRNVWRRRLRTALTLCGIGMGIGAFVALVGFSRSFEHAWLEMYENAGTDLAVVQKTFLNTSVDESVGPVLRQIPQVEIAAPMVINMMAVTPEVNTLVYGWKADTFEFAALNILQGRRFRDGQQEAMLGELLAGSLNKKVGDTIDLQGSTFTVVGIFRSGSALETGAIILPLDEMQNLSSMTGKVTAYHVKLKPAPAGVSRGAVAKAGRGRGREGVAGFAGGSGGGTRGEQSAGAAGACGGVGHVADRAAGGGAGDCEHDGDVGVRAHEGDWRAARDGMVAVAGDDADPYRGGGAGGGGRRGGRVAGMGGAADSWDVAADGEHRIDDAAGGDAAGGAADGDAGGRAGGVGAGVARGAAEPGGGAAA